MTPVPVFSYGPELFVYTLGGRGSAIAENALLWPLVHVVDRMQP